MKTKTFFWTVLIFVSYALLLVFPSLGAFNLFDWDEINFAESSREMLRSSNFFQVQVNFEPFHEKPPLFFWLQFLSMKFFGVNAFAARFPNALLAIITPLVLYRIGSNIKNNFFGLIWALTYLCGLLPNLYFRTGIIDPYFNLFIFLSLYFFHKSFFVKSIVNISIAAFFAGLALITKGPVALLVIFLVTLIFYFYSGKKINIKQFLIFVLILLVTSFIWYGYEIYNKGLWFLVEFIKYQMDLFSRPVAGHKQPLYYHFLVLLFGCFPFSFFAIKNCFKSSGSKMSFELLMRILLWVVLILFTIVTTKIIHYSSLAYFPLSFLAAIEFHKLYLGKKLSSLLKWFLVFFPFILSLLMSGIIYLFIHDKFLLSEIIKDKNFHVMINQEIIWSGFEWLIPLFLFFCSLIWLFFNKKGIILQLSLFMIFIGCFFSLNAFYVVPKVEKMTQGSAVTFYESISKQKKYLTTVGFKSYAHFFYGKIDELSKDDDLFIVKNNILKNVFNVNSLNELDLNDKFSFNSHVVKWLINEEIDRPAYFVTKSNRSVPQLENSPNLVMLKKEGGYVFYKRK